MKQRMKLGLAALALSLSAPLAAFAGAAAADNLQLAQGSEDGEPTVAIVVSPGRAPASLQHKMPDFAQDSQASAEGGKSGASPKPKKPPLSVATEPEPAPNYTPKPKKPGISAS
ncbi:MAG TPA: hypothetical protein VFA75_00315 [Nevskia sp.]|nr:hypothetical protein [Nevskia sp.]